jgi:hypothetical protein
MVLYFSIGSGFGEFLGALFFPFIYVPYKLIKYNTGYNNYYNQYGYYR